MSEDFFLKIEIKLKFQVDVTLVLNEYYFRSKCKHTKKSICLQELNKFEDNLRKLFLDDDVKLYSQKTYLQNTRKVYMWAYLCICILFLHIYIYIHIYLFIRLYLSVCLYSFFIGYSIHFIIKVCLSFGINSFLEPIFRLVLVVVKFNITIS